MGKLEDMEYRKTIIEILKVAVRTKNIEDAKYFGTLSKQLKEKIETHDYTEQDRQERNVAELDHKFSQLMRGNNAPH